MAVMLLEWVFTSAFLVLVVLSLRAALGKRMSARLRYALWAVVLVRLLVPVQLFSSPLARTWVLTEKRTEQIDVDAYKYSGSGAEGDALDALGGQDGPALSTFPQWPGAPTAPDAPEPPDLNSLPGWTVYLGWAWLAGSAIVAAVFLLSNLRFYGRLRRERVPLDGVDLPLRVYVAAGLPSPCLFGLLRPAIYVTPEAAADPDMLRHVLAHEYTHFRHSDHIWSLLRCAALAVHWWNPLVWVSAVLSQRDAELACDEGTLKRLGEAERAGYGSTLLALVTAEPRPGDLFRCATTMAGDKKSLKERISRIAKAPKRGLWAVAVAVLVTALACVCAFGQAAEDPGTCADDFTADLAFSLEETEWGPFVHMEGAVGRFQIPSGTYWCPMSATEAAEQGTLCIPGPPFGGADGAAAAWWADADRTSVTVTGQPSAPDTGYTGWRVFTVKLDEDGGTVTESHLHGTEENVYFSSLSDEEAVTLARVAAKLLTAAEDYFYGAVDELLPGTGPSDPPRADLNRNGVPETLRVVEFDDGMGQRLEAVENGEVIWSQEGFSAHAGWVGLFLCTLDGEDYLLRYTPTMYGGICDYTYTLFTLDQNGGERAAQRNSVGFDVNFGTPVYTGNFDPEAIAAFMDEINGLLAHSVQLLNTDQELLGTFENEGRLYDSLWWLDGRAEFTRDPSKSLLENLRGIQEAAGEPPAPAAG